MSLFSFWQRIHHADRVHPDDALVLNRVNHGFDLRALPTCFIGPLKTASVVLLYLNPGFCEYDLVEAESEVGRARYARTRLGTEPLPSRDEHQNAYQWWTQRTSVFGRPEELTHKVAVINIGCYHSVSFNDWPLLASLPSSRVMLQWAQETLFPQAEEGRRVVICLRAARYWGLGDGQRYGKGLFAPTVTRGGHMLRNDLRSEAILSAQEAIYA